MKKKEEDWWERHESYIEHRKTYPYGKPPKIKDERTPSEKLQDEIEPIPYPCPMHEDYDEINDVEKGGKINEKITQSIQGKVIYLWNFKKEWKAGLAGKGRAVPGRILYSTFGI